MSAESVPDWSESMLAAARKVAAHAYAPYSGAQVGCALRSVSGRVYLGCNVENASYGLTLCAERSAIAQAVAEEGPEFRWEVGLVVALGRSFPPCGACRQVLAEFAMEDAVFGFQSKDGIRLRKMAEWLPDGFSASSLEDSSPGTR